MADVLTIKTQFFCISQILNHLFIILHYCLILLLCHPLLEILILQFHILVVIPQGNLTACVEGMLLVCLIVGSAMGLYTARAWQLALKFNGLTIGFNNVGIPRYRQQSPSLIAGSLSGQIPSRA